jgi:hypothetical protein
LTSPDKNVPEGSYLGSTVYQIQSASKQQSAVQTNGWLLTVLQNFQNNLVTQFLAGFASVAEAIGAGIGTVIHAITGVFGDLTDLSNYFRGQEQAIQDLQDANMVLEGVNGYGQWTRATKYAYDATPRTIQNDLQTGPLVGCSMISPGVVQFHSPGLWQIHARCYFGLWIGSYTNNYVNLVVEVSEDNFSTIYTAALSQIIPDHGSFQTNSGTAQILVNVPVPRAGFRVRWRFQTDPARRIGGGSYWNQIGVLHLSQEAGPGMRLRSPFVIQGTDWVKVGPMVATGGGSVVDDGAIVQPNVTSVRVDAVLTGSGQFDVRMMARDTDVVAESLGQSSHQLVSQGAATPGDKFDLWVRDPSGSGAVTLNAVNGTWLTIIDRATLSSEAP